MKRTISAENGKKGGRPHADKYNSVYNIPEIKTVNITENQYKTLLKIYGIELMKKAISILDYWLCSSPVGIKYKGKNNYAYFRRDGWVINEAKRI